MSDDTAEIIAKLDHIKACAEVWEESKVSRVRAILRTADEISRLVQGEPQKARRKTR